MPSRTIKTCLLILILSFSSNLFADYNITVNIDGEQYYSEETGATNNKAVSTENDGSISISYSGSKAKSDVHPDQTSGIGAKHRSKKKYENMIARAAEKHQVDPKLLHAVIQAESAYNAKAVSPAGAVGLMQLMPGTARQYGVADRRDPSQNIEGGTRYLKHLLEIFDSNLNLTLAAYNAGENAVIRNHNHIPPYSETRNYVREVLSLQKHMKRGDSGANYKRGSSNPFESWGYSPFISDID